VEGKNKKEERKKERKKESEYKICLHYLYLFQIYVCNKIIADSLELNAIQNVGLRLCKDFILYSIRSIFHAPASTALQYMVTLLFKGKTKVTGNNLYVTLHF
jgi:hypothetical protein